MITNPSTPWSPQKSVYCYYFPEVRNTINQLQTQNLHNLLLSSIQPGLDDFHIPIIKKYVENYQNQLSGIQNFDFQYITNGASEGIFHILSKIATQTPSKPIYLLKGEYEGYAGYGKNLGLKFIILNNLNDFENQKPGIVFISNPSARDGNIINSNEIIQICESGHEIYYDATYVGLTDPYIFNLNHPSIKAVFISLSKPFGLYYYRIGITFSRDSLPTLEVNKWFKNIHSLMIAQLVLNQFKPNELINKYRQVQMEAIKSLNAIYNWETIPSDVLLIANQPINSTMLVDQNLESFNRSSNYRFCLTPYFLEAERTIHVQS